MRTKVFVAAVFAAACATTAAASGGATRALTTVSAGNGDAGVPPAPAARAAYASPSLALVSSLDARDELLADGSDPDEGGSEPDPAKMFALSLIVPGSGQIVQGQKRGYIYLLAEVAFWAGFFALDNKGLDERGDYENYADDYWDHEAYYAWYEENCVGCEDCGYECRPLAEYGTQEYYEDIGKYQTYWRWWFENGDEGGINWDEYSAEDLGNRNSYWDMRDGSNRHLRQARYLLMAAFLNHLVSGVDSFLSARSGGERPSATAADLGLEFDVPDSGEGLTCALVARY